MEINVKNINLSLGVCLALCSFGTLNAAENLEEALVNGKLKTELKAAYVDQTNDGSPYNNENMLTTGIEMSYVTDPLYGFRIGLTGQGNASPLNDDQNSKQMNRAEWWATGFVLSEAYLGYTFDKTDIKAGRQYVNMPLVSGNYTRAFKEAFEGVSVYNNNLPDTEIQAGWFYKFQGRTNAVMSADSDKDGRAPVFKDRVVLGGVSPYAREFDNIFTIAAINKSIQDTTFTGSYARVTNFASGNGNGDVNLFFGEVNYIVPLDMLKLVFDARYNGSRVDGEFDKENFDGDMLGLRAGFKDFYGFSLYYAYTTVSDKDSTIISVGNGGNTYTFLPIRGPFVYSNQAGMDTHKILLEYNFAQVGVDGLKAAFHYVNGEQDSKNNRTNKDVDIKGWATVVNYAVKQVKGLSAAVFYSELEKDPNKSDAKTTEQDEIWLRVSYKFDVL